MNKFIKGYSLIFALALIIGETLVVLKTNKYWPLSLDDYIAAAALIAVIILAQSKEKMIMFLPVIWSFICGNLYAMLFTRLDPVTGSGERIALLVIALSAALVGLFSAAMAVWKTVQVNRQS